MICHNHCQKIVGSLSSSKCVKIDFTKKTFHIVFVVFSWHLTHIWASKIAFLAALKALNEPKVNFKGVCKKKKKKIVLISRFDLGTFRIWSRRSITWANVTKCEGCQKSYYFIVRLTTAFSLITMSQHYWEGISEVIWTICNHYYQYEVSCRHFEVISTSLYYTLP